PVEEHDGTRRRATWFRRRSHHARMGTPVIVDVIRKTGKHGRIFKPEVVVGLWRLRKRRHDHQRGQGNNSGEEHTLDYMWGRLPAQCPLIFPKLGIGRGADPWSARVTRTRSSLSENQCRPNPA